MNLRAKNVLCGAALALLCLLLAACVDVQLRFDVRADGSGSAEYTVEIPKDGAASLGLTAEKVKAEMLKDRQFQRPGVKTSIGRAANGNQTVTVSMPFTSVQELSSGDLGFEFQKTPDGRQCTFRIRARGAEVVPVRAQAEVRMPGRITGSNADQVNGNVARFSSIFRADGLWVQSETGAFLSGTMLAAVLGGVAAILVIVLLMVRMNKKRAGPPRRVARAAGAVYCRQCGTDNKPGDKFCGSCGAPLAATPSPASAPAASRCPRCGKELTPDKKFCPVCGTPVAAAAAPAAAPPLPPPPLRTAPAPQPAANSVMMIALGASLVLLLLAIVLLVYWLYFQNRAAAPPAAPAQTATSAQPAPEAPAPPVTAEPQAGVRTQPVQVKAAEVPAAVSEPGRPSPMPQAQPQTAPPAPPPGSQPQPSSSSAPPEQPAADSQPALAPPAPAAPSSAASAPAAPAQPAYSGPRSGVIVWSGQLERDGLIEISGEVASSGTLRGNLPGVPVIVEIEPKDVGVAEAPSPQNDWRRLVLRSRSRRLSVVTIKWSVIR